MQQRQYRPGDVLDDYCPRERRVTDHAIVAMVESEIQRTRCVVVRRRARVQERQGARSYGRRARRPPCSPRCSTTSTPRPDGWPLRRGRRAPPAPAAAAAAAGPTARPTDLPIHAADDEPPRRGRRPAVPSLADPRAAAAARRPGAADPRDPRVHDAPAAEPAAAGARRTPASAADPGGGDRLRRARCGPGARTGPPHGNGAGNGQGGRRRRRKKH